MTRQASPDITTVVLLRHAKSDYPSGVIDHDRPLNPRGRRDAPAAGRWLAGQVNAGAMAVPDLVLCSTATRTLQTWDLARVGAAELGVVLPGATPEHSIYEASVESLWALLTWARAQVSNVLLVGHAPAIPDLALALAGPSSDRRAVEAVHHKYPTSGVALVELPPRPMTAEPLIPGVLRSFVVPRG